MSRQPKEHVSMWIDRGNPIVELYDKVRLRTVGEWPDGKGGVHIVPAGSEGEVYPWSTDLGVGIAIDFFPISHPVFKLFPMTLHQPGASRYSDDIELIRRREPLFEKLESTMPRERVPEEAPAGGSHVRR